MATFNTEEGDLYAVFGWNGDNQTEEVDALLWISEDGNSSYYIVGSQVYQAGTAHTNEYLVRELYSIPVADRGEVVDLVMSYEGMRPGFKSETLLLNDVLDVMTQ